MGTRDNRVDAYIARSAEFAQPILTHLRALVHGACPGVTETIKWGFPHFEHKGVLCSMAAFKAHCAFGFWHADMRANADARAGGDAAMGQFGRIAKLADLPKDAGVEGADPQGGGTQRIRRQVATRSESHAEGAVRGAGRPRRGAARKPRRAGKLRCDEPEPSPRIHRMARRTPSATRLGASASRPRSNGSGKARPRSGSTARADAHLACLGVVRRQSITSSARWSTDGGRVMPSALAVARLITSSKVVGCSMGRSPGFAPFRILST